MADLHLAYVMGRYPAVSHTFIQREIQALRDLGVKVETFSIHDAGAEHVLSRADELEYAATYSVLPTRTGAMLGAHLRAFAHRPLRYLTTLAFAIGNGTPGLRGRLWQVFYFLEAMVVWSECQRRGVRHLHAHFAHQAADVALLVAHFGRDRGWSWSLTVHGPTEFRDPNLIRLPLKINRARFVVCISDYTRSQVASSVEEAEWSKIHVVHCGVDPEVFAVPAEPREPDDTFRILTVGRLVPLKAHNIVIETIAELGRRGIPAHLTLVGDGPNRPQLMELARNAGLLDERVRFTGAVGQDTIRELYSEADAFCLASFGEGVPVVLMEAMAMGIPVVATRIMGIPELVENDVSGLLVSPGRGDLLADALEKLAADPERRHAMGEAGRAKVMAEFSLRDSAAGLRASFAAALAADSDS